MSRTGVGISAVVASLAVGLFLGPAASAQVETPSISGTVTDSDGNPVVDYCVNASRFWDNTSHSLLDVRTDSSGNYKITGAAEHKETLTPGNYRVEFRRCQSDSVPANANLIPEWWNDKSHISEADTIEVGEDEDVTGIDAELQIGGVISGTVRKPDGGAIKACLELRGPGVASGMVTMSGEFSFRRLPAGDYVLRYDDCNNEHGLAGMWFDQRPTRSQADTISLAAAEQRTGMDATLGEGGRIEGTVTGPSGAPLEGICVRVYDDDGEQWEQDQRTDADGGFEFVALFPGDYRLRYWDCDRLGHNVAEEFFDDAPTLEGASPVAVTAGQASTANAQLARGGSIAGLVRGPDQLPLEGACVYLFDDAEDSYVTNTGTDEGGGYRFGSLRTGTYRIEFNSCGADGGEEDLVEYWNNKQSLEEADPIAVTAGSERGNINATLGAPDPTAPDTILPPASINRSSAQFTFSSTISGSIFQCRLLGAGDFAPCTSPHTLSDLADGVYTFEVYAISPAGLVDETPASRAFTITAEGDCLDARRDLAATRTALGKAKKAVKKAKKAVKKAKKGGKATKVKKAKKRLRRAKRKRGAAKRAVSKAQAEVARLCS